LTKAVTREAEFLPTEFTASTLSTLSVEAEREAGAEANSRVGAEVGCDMGVEVGCEVGTLVASWALASEREQMPLRNNKADNVFIINPPISFF
jgi:hypothetical protein